MGFLNTYFELLQFIEIIYITNKCSQYVICLSFISFVRLYMRNVILILYVSATVFITQGNYVGLRNYLV